MTANSFQTQINLDQIRGKLRDALRSDSGKGGDGMLDTREVAERCGIKTATARRRLYALLNSGEVEAFDGEGNGLGKAILWRLKPAPTVSGEGEGT